MFEFGINVDWKQSPGKPFKGDWKNASTYFANNLYDALLRDAWGPSQGNSKENGAYTTWQGGIVLNPAVNSYNEFLKSQMERKFQLSHFQGIVVDRSDWIQVYDLTMDDGVSWVQSGSAYSMKRAFRDTTASLRKQMDSNRSHSCMMLNTLGYSMLSLMGPFDGTFSEGHAVNAVGLLGIVSPSILWTYTNADFDGDFDAFARRHLYMGTYPMAPFPGNDHSIDPGNETVMTDYARYGPLFKCLKGAKWDLRAHAAHVVAPVEGMALVNAFVDSEDDQYFSVVVEAKDQMSDVIIDVLLAKKSGPSFHALYPNGSPVWKHLANVSLEGNRARISVPILGDVTAAMVRIKY